MTERALELMIKDVEKNQAAYDAMAEAEQIGSETSGRKCNCGTVAGKVESLDWVTYVTETDRDDSEYRVESDLSVLRMDHEIHEIENLGTTVVAYSGVPEHGTRLFIR